MNLHYLCLNHHLSCQEDMFMVEKALAKNYKVGPNSINLLSFKAEYGVIVFNFHIKDKNTVS